MEAEINHLKQDFHSHEKSNELTFTKLEESLKNFDMKIDKLIGILINKNKNENSN